MPSILNAVSSRKNLSERSTRLFCLLLVLVITASWALYTFNKTAPSSEGWYVVYANLILDGYIPYVDFEFLYPPLYAYLSTFVVFLFGNSLLAFRTLGVFLIVLIAIVVFLIFETIVPSWIAAIGSVITTFAIQGDVFFITYDYHAVFALFVLVSMLFMIKGINDYSDTFGRGDAYSLMSGLMISLAFLIRPQSGVLLLAFFIFFFLFVRLNNNFKVSSKRISLYVLGLIVPIVITSVLLVHAGAFSQSIEMVFFGETKGSIFNMLTGWTEHIKEDLIRWTFIFVPFLVYGSVKSIERRDSEFTNFTLYFLLIFFVSAIVLLALIPQDYISRAYRYILDDLSFYWPTTFFIFESVITITLFCKLVVSRNKSGTLSPDSMRLLIGGFAIVYAIGHATSGPLSYVGTALTFGTVTVSFFHYASGIPISKLRKGVHGFFILLVALLLVSVITPRVETPYYWWGNPTSSYYDADCEADVAYFDGIKMSAEKKYMYEDFQENAEKYLGPDDELYCYANIPIFYTIAGKTPSVKSVVPWFDVSRSSSIRGDLEYMNSNNPKMIVFNDHTLEAVNVHTALYGDKSAHLELYLWLLECRDGEDSKYEVISTYTIATHSTYLMVLK